MVFNDCPPLPVETIQTYTLKHRIDNESGYCGHANARQVSQGKR